ncbi:hypothetical protein B0H11DRAFT_2205768 [Mycena galericulata]|nr:hypothetical protein B0H11DRAFT_2146495 [Mycena galericulata]KAJ7439397.1 hypothetical protein B0H11DRAFT_2205768 [Mycena galericulata]
MPSSKTTPHFFSPYNQSSSSTRLRPGNPFSDRFNAAMGDLHLPVSTNEELRAMVQPFARNEAHLQELTNKLISVAEANIPESGQFAIFGATPEESGETPFEISNLPGSSFRVRFFCGASPRGVLFFDFVEGHTGKPVDLPKGYSLWQRLPTGNTQLMSLHAALGGATPAGHKERFALQEGTWIMLKNPDGQEYDFQSPVIPRPRNGSR